MARRQRTWPIFLFAFAFLTALMASLGYYAFRVAERIHAEVSAIHEAHQKSASALSQFQLLMYQSAMLLRDLAINPGLSNEPRYRTEFSRIRASVRDQLAVLEGNFGRDSAGVLSRLRREVKEYWKLQEPVFQGAAEQKMDVVASYLRQQIAPRRLAVLTIADQVDRLNRANLEREAEYTAVSLKRSRRFLGVIFAGTLVLALLATSFTIVRVFRLERQSQKERDRAELAEQELRRLSHQLVRAQEEERKAISRELHDEIGQTLTALRIELGRMDRLRTGPEQAFRDHVEESKALAEKSLRAARDMAMGLRPSMLDDLGLGPALGWQAREFHRRTGVPVSFECSQDLASLPDPIRTCLYRVAQEALTNCARHAEPKTVLLRVEQNADAVSLLIEDDGVGFDPSNSRGRGLGLIGIEERVNELGGTVTVSSRTYLGTRVKVEIPLIMEEPHGQGSNSAGG